MPSPSPRLSRRPPVAGLILAALLLAACEQVAVVDLSPPRDRPNIIFIMADDLGYGDLTPYGQQRIRTPNLDRLASLGTVFTDYYAGSTVCAPSRAVLLTGQHTGRNLVRNNVGWQPRGDMPLREADVTVAEVLREAGYATGAFGKWALGLEGTPGAPHRQGFDTFFGYTDQSEAHQHYPGALQYGTRDTTFTVAVDPEAYAHNLIADSALAFIDRHAERPFFLYLPFTLPHADLAVPDSSLARYLDAEGESVFAEKPFPGGGYTAQEAPFATYAAMVSVLDRDVGRIVNRLKRLGLDDDTVVFFTSDNGPHGEGGYDPSYFDSNGRLRGMKRDLYEGGIRVPMIAWGPGRVADARRSSQVWAAWDVLPTLADLAGADLAGADVDGVSMREALEGAQPSERPYLYWEFFDPRLQLFKQAVREGPWKAHRWTRRDGSSRVSLFNLDTDVGEASNLAATEPDRLERLLRLMDEAHTEPDPEFALWR